jgi:hypothetical protein
VYKGVCKGRLKGVSVARTVEVERLSYSEVPSLHNAVLKEHNGDRVAIELICTERIRPIEVVATDKIEAA